MKGPVTASGRDLHTLAGIVSDDRGEPPAEGLAPSFLSDLLELIRCDLLVFEGHDSRSTGSGRLYRSSTAGTATASRCSGSTTGMTSPAATLT
jgi:hypothetical protein